LTPNELVLFGVLTSVPILVKIDQEMPPWECSQTDRHTHRQTDRHTDSNRFYNLSHAICYSYETDCLCVYIATYLNSAESFTPG